MDVRTALTLSRDYLDIAVELFEAGADPDRVIYYCRRSHETLENPDAYHGEALVVMKRGDFGAARDLLRQAIEADPTFGNAWNDLGACLFALDQPVEAIPCFEEALRVRYETPEKAHYNLGRVYEALGDLEAAKRKYHDALAAAPAYILARAALERLDEPEPRQP